MQVAIIYCKTIITQQTWLGNKVQWIGSGPKKFPRSGSEFGAGKRLFQDLNQVLQEEKKIRVQIMKKNLGTHGKHDNAIKLSVSDPDQKNPPDLDPNFGGW